MTDQDRADIPAKECDFRAVNPKTREVTYLQQPELIRYFFPECRLEKRNEDGSWSTFLLPEESDVDPRPENV